MGVCTAVRDKNLTPALLKPFFFCLFVTKPSINIVMCHNTFFMLIEGVRHGTSEDQNSLRRYGGMGNSACFK